MKKAVIVGRCQAGLIEVPDPKPREDWVVVKVHAAPMCTEYKSFAGGTRQEYLGHEAAGEVVEVARSESSKSVAGRVAEARNRQLHRFSRCRIFCNAQMSNRQLRRHAVLDTSTKKLLQGYADAHDLSGRAIHRSCKVARTLADLEASPQITEEHMALALTMQQARWA